MGRYIRKQKLLRETKTNLALTERLLGDEREENELMGKAWSIAEDDLTFGPIIGEGTCVDPQGALLTVILPFLYYCLHSDTSGWA